jgi:hypothetical protein
MEDLVEKETAVKSERAAPTEPPPVFPPVESTSVEEENPDRNWPMLAALLVAALAFAILVGIAAVSIYHHVHKPPPAPADTNALPPPPPANLQPGQ